METDNVPTTRDLLDQGVQAEPYASEDADPELVVHLRDQIRELEHQRDLAEAIHRSEVAIITEKLIEAADQNEMCGTYDAVIDHLNRHLTVKLGIREQENTLRIEGSITLDFTRYLGVRLPYNQDLDSDLTRERARSALRAMGLRWITDQADPDSWDISIESVEYD